MEDLIKECLKNKTEGQEIFSIVIDGKSSIQFVDLEDQVDLEEKLLKLFTSDLSK